MRTGLKDLIQRVAGGGGNASLWTADNPRERATRYAAPSLTDEQKDVVRRFHDLYYNLTQDDGVVRTYFVSWLGYEMFKCPLDLWVYQDIISACRPELIIETGTYRGGSALYLATLCDLLGTGKVVSIDVDMTFHAEFPRHPRITYLTGSSVSPEILERVKEIAHEVTNILVILDSDHRRDHVVAELAAYSEFVPVGGYLIVEDTNINGHPTYPDFGPGPWEAVDRFLSERDDFVSDGSCERFLMTMNPKGFLKRVK